MQTNIQEYINFWTYYQSPDLKLTKLFDWGLKINAATDAIKNIYLKLDYTDSVDNIDIAMYLALIDNAPAAASNLMKKQN